jgi:hypothetical protein
MKPEEHVALYSYVDGMRRLAGELRGMESDLRRIPEAPADHPTVGLLCSVLDATVEEVVTLAARAMVPLLLRTESDQTAHAVWQYAARVQEFRTSARWLSYVPGSGKPEDPYDFGFKTRAEIVEAVYTDLGRHAEDATELAHQVERVANLEPRTEETVALIRAARSPADLQHSP